MFPHNVGQIPIFYSEKNTGRPYDPESKYTTQYLDSPNDPLYVFGYGLSYTTFDYNDITLSKDSIGETESLEIIVRVTNSGNYDGEEVAQLYLHDPLASVARPVRELKGFRKVFIPAGQSVDVTFSLRYEDLAFYRHDMTFGPEKGEFRIYIGGNSMGTTTAAFRLE